MSLRLNFYFSESLNEIFTDELNNIRIYYLKGADFQEKYKCIQIIADIMQDYDCEFYYSPFEKYYPCGLYLPKFKAFIATELDEPSIRLDCHYYNIGMILHNVPEPVKKIANYTFNQSQIYQQKSEELLQISNIILKEYRKASWGFLNISKLKSFLKRKISPLMPKIEKSGCIIKKSVSTINDCGYKIVDFPEDFKIIDLNDDFISASYFAMLYIKSLAKENGYTAIVSGTVNISNAPMNIIVPELKLVFISSSNIFPNNVISEKINLKCFYYKFSEFENYLTLLEDFLIKLYKETASSIAVCYDVKCQGRRILLPFVNEPVISEITADIIYDITNE